MDVKNGSIDFNHVEFTYNDEAEKDTLIDIDLHIHFGETGWYYWRNGMWKIKSGKFNQPPL